MDDYNSSLSYFDLLNWEKASYTSCNFVMNIFECWGLGIHHKLTFKVLGKPVMLGPLIAVT